MLLLTVNSATPSERLRAIAVIREATATTTNTNFICNPQTMCFATIDANTNDAGAAGGVDALTGVTMWCSVWCGQADDTAAAVLGGDAAWASLTADFGCL